MSTHFAISLSSLRFFKKLVFYTLGFAMLVSTLNGCDDDDDESPIEIKLVANATLGTIMTDKEGRTLYYFSNDATGASTCAGNCELLWPPFYVENLTAAKLGEGLSESDFTTTTMPSGKPILVYKGRPLYYYAPLVGANYTLESPGQTTG